MPRQIRLQKALCIPSLPIRQQWKACREDRLLYNDRGWELVYKTDSFCMKFKKFRFHHEVVTNSVSASLLFSREVPKAAAKKRSAKKKQPTKKKNKENPCRAIASSWESVDSGKRT